MFSRTRRGSKVEIRWLKDSTGRKESCFINDIKIYIIFFPSKTQYYVFRPVGRSLETSGDFDFHGSVHRNSILIYIQKDSTLHSLFYLETILHVSGWYHHPSSVAQTTVSTASGNRYTVLLSAAVVEDLELV